MRKFFQPLSFVLVLLCCISFSGCKKDYRSDFIGNWNFHVVTTVTGSGGGTTTTDYKGSISDASTAGVINLNILPSVTIIAKVDKLGNLTPGNVQYNISGNFSSKNNMSMDANNTGLNGGGAVTDYTVTGSR